MNKLNKILTLFLVVVIIAGFGYYWIPKFKPFGNSTTFADSTNYVTLNKGLYVFDSIKTDKDLIVKGKVVLDTLRQATLEVSGLNLQITNVKENGSQIYSIGNKNSNYAWYKTSGSGSTQLAQLDTINGLVLNGYNLATSSTGQIKLPSDSASDYDGNNSITLNRQSGKLKTKSLTTASGTFYDLTLVNSLITTSSKVMAIVEYGYGTNTSSCIVNHYIGSNGSAVIALLPNSAGALNGTVGVTFVIFN